MGENSLKFIERIKLFFKHPSPCDYVSSCKHFRPTHYTCNSDFDARRNCGVRKEIEDVRESLAEIKAGKAKKFDDTESFLKDLKDTAIATKNVERRKNTLGYGIRGKFKPRPASEKKLWRLDKKPPKKLEDED